MRKQIARKGEPLRYLLDRVLRYDGDGCLPWPYARGADGRGSIYYEGRQQYAHRVVCLLINGPSPTDRHQAAHSCGNGRGGCVSPKHLRWATATENSLDKVAHGTSIRGEANHFAKLTDPQVSLVRSLRGKIKQREIAAIVGVSQSNISRILSQDTWRGADVA